MYGGALVSLMWTMEQPTVVTIHRWSFNTSGLKTGLTVHYFKENHTTKNHRRLLFDIMYVCTLKKIAN